MHIFVIYNLLIPIDNFGKKKQLLIYIKQIFVIKIK